MSGAEPGLEVKVWEERGVGEGFLKVGVFCDVLGAWGMGRSVRREGNVWDGGEVGRVG